MNSKCEALDDSAFRDALLAYGIQRVHMAAFVGKTHAQQREDLRLANAAFDKVIDEMRKLAATPVPTPRAQMDGERMRSALRWIADRYSDRKTTRECADDAYDMACLARSVIGTPVVPDETDMGRARKADPLNNRS